MESSRVHLRPFRHLDLDVLCQIDQGCFPPGIAYSREELRGFIGQPNSRTWVADKDHEICGFLVAEKQADNVGHIITIDVVDAHRRLGIGSRLIGAAEDWARREGWLLIYLETAENNRPAQRFYENRGYTKYKKIPRYYSNQMDAWVMVKWLS